MEKFQIINYNSKPAVKIEREHLNELKRGDYCGFSEYLKLVPKEENLIIEMLPEEILLYIFQFLSPGDLIRIASTCTTLNELSEDKNTWRNISYNYNQFFIFDKVQVQQRDYVYQEYQIPIYGIIEKTKLPNDNIDSNKLKKTKSNLTGFFRRRNQSQYDGDNEYELDNLFNKNEIKNNLIEYIEKIPNPKEELISKANLIYNGIKERKQQIDENLKRKKENQKRYRKERRMKEYSFMNLFFLALGFTAFIITLNIYIEKKLSSNTIYVFIPLLLPILIYIILFFYMSKFERDFIFSIFGIIMIMLFIQILLIGLRSDSTIKGSWLLIFLPFFIFIGITILGSFIWIFTKSNYEIIDTTLPMVVIMIFLFLIFLGLRLDETIKWNYGVVFIPLFFLNLTPCWMSFSLCCGESDEEYGFVVLIYFFCLFFIISVPVSILEILIVLFIEVSKFNHITYAFIPLYIALPYILCGLSTISC